MSIIDDEWLKQRRGALEMITPYKSISCPENTIIFFNVVYVVTFLMLTLGERWCGKESKCDVFNNTHIS